MAFFTRVNLNVPVLPPDESNPENSLNTIPEHKKSGVETNCQNHNSNPTRPNNLPNSLNHRPSAHVIRKMASVGTSTTLSNGSSPTEPTATVPEETEEEAALEAQKSDDDSEPKRYEYVVDRVLGVEV